MWSAKALACGSHRAEERLDAAWRPSVERGASVLTAWRQRAYGVLGDFERSFLDDPERRTHALFVLIFVHSFIECAQ